MHVALVAGGHPYDFVMPAASFRSGKEYVYTLKTAGNGVEIEDITITGWQPGGNYRRNNKLKKEQEKAMKKKIYTLSVLLAAVLPAGAQSIKSDINTVLNDIALPVFLGVMVMALAVGIGKNWRLINDENSEGNKKQGWMNVAYMVGYVLIAVTVISFCVGKIAGVSFSI